MRTLGICWIVYGIFRLGMGAGTWMGLFHVVYVCWIGLCFVCGILGIVGGLALMRSPNGGRSLLVAASLLSLSDLPVGIAIGVYTLIELLRGSQPATREDIS